MLDKNIFFFLQARIGSTRLPGKVLLPFYENDTILDIIIDKLKANFPEIPVIVCTSDNDLDNSIESYCNEKNVQCFRGSENNVLKRFFEAANFYKTDTIIRVCADNPFLDISFMKELLEFHYENPNADYWSFKTGDNIPVIKTHFGFFAEIVSKVALKKVLQNTFDPLYLEHVTNYIYSNNNYETKLKPLPDYLINRTDLRFTIDDLGDFTELQKVFQFYKKNSNDIKKTISFADNNEVIVKKMVSNIIKYSK